ncbi:MAG: hypothetical protein WBD28_03405 [Candidatus Zixiibacteriota bacterium]
MDWKEHLKKIKSKAEENLEKEEAEAEVLALDLAEKIEESREILKEFASVTRSRIKLLNQRHREIDPDTRETYYAGGVVIYIRKKLGFFGQVFKKEEEPLIAKLKFPHPVAIMNQEGFEDSIEFIYSDTEKKATINEFNPEWLKQNLEVAYSLFINEQKII